MRKRESAEIAMCANIKTFLTENKHQFTAFVRLNKEIDHFLALCATMQPFIVTHFATATGITADKNMAFDQLADLIIELTCKTSLFAKDTNNHVLAGVLNILPSDFKYQSEYKKLIQAQGVITAIVPYIHLLAPYVVTEKHLTDIADCIAICKTKSTAVSTARNNKKTAVVAIANTLKSTRASLAIIDVLISSIHADSHSGLVNQYQNYRHIAGKKARYTGISASLTDSATGKILAGATISLPILGRTATANGKGVATIIRITKGDYEMHCAASGYATQIITVKVTRGRMVKVGVGMVVG